MFKKQLPVDRMPTAKELGITEKEYRQRFLNLLDAIMGPVTSTEADNEKTNPKRKHSN